MDEVKAALRVPVGMVTRIVLLLIALSAGYICGSAAYQTFREEGPNWSRTYRHSPEPLEVPLRAIGKVVNGNIPLLTAPLVIVAVAVLLIADVYPLPILMHVFLFVGVASLDDMSMSWHVGTCLIAIAALLSIAMDFILLRPYLPSWDKNDRFGECG